MFEDWDRPVIPLCARLRSRPPSPFAVGLPCYHVDDYQQYLAKHVNGYRCHANTGVPFPVTPDDYAGAS